MDKKKTVHNKTNFDRLASDLTKKERKDILKRINPADIEIKIPSENDLKNKESEKENLANTKKGLVLNFKKEPFFKKLVVWVKSLFLNVSVEEVYNNAVISALARRIEVLYPGLIDFKRKMLCNTMYKELLELQQAQDFFRTQLRIDDTDSGVFYYLLCLQHLPDFSESVRAGCDPFQYDFERPLGQEARNSFLNKIDESLGQMPADMKEKIGDISQSFEWLKTFVRLPIGVMLNKFSVAGEDRSCLFVQVKNEYSEFAKVLCSKKQISDDFLTSLYLTTTEIKDLWKGVVPECSKEDLDKLLSTASAEITNINMFCRKYPLREIGKVINENSLYVPETFSCGDNWFVKYREQWRIVFDQRWRLWNKEYKKEEIKKKMKVFFNIPDFQKFPYHPWRKYEDEFPFRFDLSLGFINYYFKQEYQKYASILNVVTLEGDFQIKENRHEFTDLVADFNEIMDKLEVLVSQVSLGGEYGAEFMRYEGSIKSNSNKEKLKIVINEMEEAASYITEVFINSGHKFELLVSAMLGEHATVYYGPLTNLNKIMGRDNREFRETLSKFTHSIKYAGEILTALKEIDSFRV
ncbi:DUF5312 family protein [Treponema sp.]|uniref:DUF5312 family protein n=1 Tax=Treponema sp. TaxID=166 RepID=UPI0038909F0F